MTRSFILLAAFLLSAGFAGAQKIKEAQVPAPVLKAFNEQFKGMKAKDWEKRMNGTYEAGLKDKNETAAIFSSDGEFLETEVRMKTSGLPKVVSDHIAKAYAGFKIKEAAKITDTSGRLFYETEIEKGKEEKILIFNSDGVFVKENMEAEEDD